jgi:hypothetical protein
MKDKEFKIGDRVRISLSSRFDDQCSEPGTITSIRKIQDSHLPFTVKFDNDYCNTYALQDLVHHKEQEFNVGDKVLITQGSSIWDSGMDQYVGKEATITSKESYYYFIDLDNGTWSWHPSEGHFIHAPQKDISEKDSLLEKAKQMFPIGSKVMPAHLDFNLQRPDTYIIIIDTDFTFFPNGDIVQLLPNGDLYDISSNPKWGGDSWNRTLYYKSQNKWAKIINVAEDKLQSPTLKHKYKVGDELQLVKEYNGVSPRKVTISALTSRNGKPAYDLKSWVGEFSEDVLSLQSEVSTHKFKVGDWVIANEKVKGYYYTIKQDWSGQVVKINDDGTIDIQGKYNVRDNGYFRILEPERFDLTTEHDLIIENPFHSLSDSHTKTCSADAIISTESGPQWIDFKSASLDKSVAKVGVDRGIVEAYRNSTEVEKELPVFKVKKVNFNRI